jgi:hypothetical protein
MALFLQESDVFLVLKVTPIVGGGFLGLMPLKFVSFLCLIFELHLSVALRLECVAVGVIARLLFTEA